MLRAGIIAAAATGAAFAGAAPAHAADIWIEVNPSTIQAGYSVAVRGSCGDNVNPAKAQSDAFGDLQMLPQNGFLYAVATVPPGKKATGYTVKLSCPNGSSATTTLFVLGMSTPTKGPNSGGGGLAAGGGLGGGGVMVAGGLATLAAGGALGLIALRRRRA